MSCHKCRRVTFTWVSQARRSLLPLDETRGPHTSRPTLPQRLQGRGRQVRPMHTRMFACPQTHATPHSTGCSSQRPNPRPAPAPRVSCASWASSALASRWAPPSAGSPSHSLWPCTCHVSLNHPTPMGPRYYAHSDRSRCLRVRLLAWPLHAPRPLRYARRCSPRGYGLYKNPVIMRDWAYDPLYM